MEFDDGGSDLEEVEGATIDFPTSSRSPEDGSWTDSANIKLDVLLQLFPNGDFDFLKRKSLELASDDSAFESFVGEALTTDIVPVFVNQGPASPESVPPTMFLDVASFVEACPDPFNEINSLERNSRHHSDIVEILKDRFREVKTSYIEHVVVEQDYHLLRAADILQNPPPEFVRILPRDRINARRLEHLDVNLRKEVFLLDHGDEVKSFLKLKEEHKKIAVEEGQVFECECCFTDDVLLDEVIMCTEAHLFCRNCIKRTAEVNMGNGLTTFPCPLMGGCTAQGTIPLNKIKEVVNEKAYSKLMARIQEEEVRKADITGVEFCQRCEYAAIPDETTIIFQCAKCGFELCRLCNRESHIPRKCGETPEEDAQKQLRKQQEELQTTKVLRRCGGCKKAYIKDSGCNKVTCTCGTANCYLCGTHGIDYPHVDSCPSLHLQ